ncbi:MAG: DNL zinc finger domain containing [Lasallia pustulata]|uniref:DNL zinc finger domain containing n=1 Tax=Lasallia pustulata TaxID=136370 RepID=A0A5M8PU52_9LECA|nr:MAG: DNL zinc finger domain containing [Lasallia pustulata]
MCAERLCRHSGFEVLWTKSQSIVISRKPYLVSARPFTFYSRLKLSSPSSTFFDNTPLADASIQFHFGHFRRPQPNSIRDINKRILRSESRTHVISDHLKIFSDTSMTIEDLMRDNGEMLRKGSLSPDGDLEFWDDGSTTQRTEGQESSLPKELNSG